MLKDYLFVLKNVGVDCLITKNQEKDVEHVMLYT